MNKTRHHLAEVLAEKTLHTVDTKKLSREIAAYLLIENKTSELESLIRDVMQYRLQHGVVEATIVSAHELSQSVQTDVDSILREEFPEAKDIVLREADDPYVIGGIRIDLPNEQLDLTVRSKLNTFKRLTVTGKE